MLMDYNVIKLEFQKFCHMFQLQIVKVQPKGNITIPADIRKKVNIKQGGYAEITVDDGKIIIQPRYFYPLREFSKQQIKEYIVKDKLPDELKDIENKSAGIWTDR